MKPRTIMSSLLGALILCTSARTSRAQQVCVEPRTGNWDWDAYSEIKVYLHPNLYENLETSDGQKYTTYELRRDVEATMLAFQEHLAVGHPRIIVQSGYSSGVPWNKGVEQGAIHITAWMDDTPLCNWNRQAEAAGSPSGATGARITLMRSGPGFVGGVNQGLPDCNHSWAHFSETNTSRTFRGILQHELMHLFGNKHDNCIDFQPCDEFGWLGCSCGAYGAASVLESWYCENYDHARVLFAGHANFWNGAPIPDATHKEALNGYTWSSFTAIAPVFAPLAGLSSSASGLPYMFYAVRRPDYLNLYGRLYRWVYTTGAWEYWGYLGSTLQNILGVVDVAYGGSPSYPYFAYIESPAGELRKQIKVTRFTGYNQRTTWTSPADVTTQTGVSIAYDSRSGYFIIAWRDDSLAIWLTHFHPSLGFWINTPLLDGGQPVFAAEAPDVVCGDSAVGTYNCVLVWAAPMGQGSSTYQKLKWVHFGLAPWVIWQPIMEYGLVQYGAPQISYRGPSTSNAAFVLSWGVIGSAYYTIGKSKSTTSYWDWTTFRSHSSGSGTYGYSPVVGSAAGAAEMIEVWQ